MVFVFLIIQEQLLTSFYRFSELFELDCHTNPDLAAAQAELTELGWVQICFEVIASESLSDLHLPCLHLLMALTGGGNRRVQDKIHADLCDPDINPNGAFSNGLQKLFNKANVDLKTERKNAGQPDDKYVRTGFAKEMLIVMTNCCMGHQGMQDYTREQSGRLAARDLIGNVVDYMKQVERDLKAAVLEEFAPDPPTNSGTKSSEPKKPSVSTFEDDSALAFENPVNDGSPRFGDEKDTPPPVPAPAMVKRWPGVAAQDNPSILRGATGFQALKHCASGPNKVNQAYIANSDLLSIINRILHYSMYTDLKDVDERGPTLRTAKGILNAQVSFCLLALVEGLPEESVIRRLINGIDWNAVHKHLAVLKGLIDNAVLIEIPTSGNLHEVDFMSETQRPHSRCVELYVANPEKKKQAVWLRREAFRLFAFVSKVVTGGQLVQANNAGTGDVLRPLQELLHDRDLQDFFGERVGAAEVIRDGSLENVLFWMPDNYFRADDNQQISRRVKSVLNRAPRENSDEKLSHFMEGANEVISDVQSMTSARTLYGDYVPAFYSWAARIMPTMYLSFIICGVLCFSFVRTSSRSSRDKEAFTRWTDTCFIFDAIGCYNFGGYEVFTFLALLHFGLTCYRTYCFTVIRLPVLIDMSTRGAKLAYRHNYRDEIKNGLSNFARRTVVVFGVPYKGMSTSEKLAKQIAKIIFGDHDLAVPTFFPGMKKPFLRYGGVCASTLVPVDPEQSVSIDKVTKQPQWSMTTGSWALVTFLNANVVDNKPFKMKAEQKHNKKQAWIPHKPGESSD